ncbi:hypothetical protein LTR66_008931 [Elasticomyces elasticus]|nr:hypothetical protein LTR66_008931 [Elasticomyces elasticus]KAK4992127.1 hypothetical protein LTR50_001305 [Elasticomyces elasticus]
MYVEGNEESVSRWIDLVKSLRYKDYHLAVRPALVRREGIDSNTDLRMVGQDESPTVSDFGVRMRQRGVYDWWRRGMGYTRVDGL